MESPKRGSEVGTAELVMKGFDVTRSTMRV